MKRYLSLCFLLLAVAACSDKDKDAVKPAEPAEKLYNEAHDQLDKGKYKDAVKSFEEVERQHPESEWATHAEVMSGYAAYHAGDFDQAVAILERFSKMHPGNPSTPYSYYLIALCYYEQISDVARDQKMTEKALSALTEVIKRYPNSDYARAAKLKLDLTYDHLAGKEMEIGRYYEMRDQYLAAINRFRYVVESYQTTTHVPEALYRLVECYDRLGINDAAKKYAAVLGYNFPDSVWYKDAYALVGPKVAEKDKDNGSFLGVF